MTSALFPEVLSEGARAAIQLIEPEHRASPPFIAPIKARELPEELCEGPAARPLKER